MNSEDPLGGSRPVARPVTSRLQRLTNSPDRFYPENAERVNSSMFIFGPVRSLRRTRPTEPSDDSVWPSWTRVPIERLGFRLHRDDANYRRWKADAEYEVEKQRASDAAKAERAARREGGG